MARARLITEVFAELSDEDCGRAEELLLPAELRVPPRKTYTQVERIATATRRRSTWAWRSGGASRRRSTGRGWRCSARGPASAGLSGRGLPVGETLAAYASSRGPAPGSTRTGGAFPGERLDRLRAAAYLDILNGVCADDRIACGHVPSDARPCDRSRGCARDQRRRRLRRRYPRRRVAGLAAGVGGSDCPCDECDGRCAPPGRQRLPRRRPPRRRRPRRRRPAGRRRTGTKAAAADRAAENRTMATRTPGDLTVRDQTMEDRTTAPEVPAMAAVPDAAAREAAAGRPPAAPGPEPDPPCPAAIAVPSAARWPAADPGRPDPPARHPPRPRRAVR